jgi:hypothetical protein
MREKSDIPLKEPSEDRQLQCDSLSLAAFEKMSTELEELNSFLDREKEIQAKMMLDHEESLRDLFEEKEKTIKAAKDELELGKEQYHNQEQALRVGFEQEKESLE